jgi:hypothetical protein
MSAISTWSSTAANNNNASPAGAPEGMAPSGVNNTIRENMAQVRTWYVEPEWIDDGRTYTRSDGNTVTVAGEDVTSTWHAKRRVRIVGANTGTIYGKVSSSSFSTNTTINFSLPSGTIDAGDSTVTCSYSILSAVNSAVSGVLPVQKILSTDSAVATGTTVFPNDDTIPQNTEGDQYMTVGITPTNSDNTLLIQIVVNVAGNVNSRLGLGLFQDSTAGALAAAHSFGSANQPTQISLIHQMDAGTTSATTFKVRMGMSTAGTTTFNGVSAGRIFGGVMSSTITVIEFVA